MKILAAAMICVALSGRVIACPFCRSVSETVSDKLALAHVVVVAKRAAVKEPDKKARKVPYEVIEVLNDEKKHLGKTPRIVAPVIEGAPADAKYVILGAREEDFDEIYYLSPWVVSDRAIAYLKKLPGAPPKEEGVERLAFFQEFLNDEDDLIANDAYDEIARSSFADVKALGPRMHRDRLLAWVQDRSISALRRRQYLTLLSVCGKKEDGAVLEKLVLAERGGPEGALDATTACFLTLRGEAGLPLIEKRFIQNPKATRSDGQAIVAALRFHGEEEKVIPRPRLLKTLRLYLDRPEWADQVMAELARWKDWSAMDRMVKLFHEAEEAVGPDSAFTLRVPIVKYLQACPLDEAKKHLAELEKKYPKVVRAASIYPFLPVRAKSAERPKRRRDDAREKKKVEAKERSEPKKDAPSPNGKPVARTTTTSAFSDAPVDDDPVALIGFSILLAAAALLGLLLIILFAFRPRLVE